jgi:hypothetical protein
MANEQIGAALKFELQSRKLNAPALSSFLFITENIII